MGGEGHSKAKRGGWSNKSIEEGFKQKSRQRSSRLFRGGGGCKIARAARN